MQLTLAIAVLLLAAGTAAAQDAPTSAAPASAAPLPAPPTQPQGEALSETTAVGIGLVTTAVSWSLLTVGAATQHGGWAAVGGLGTFLGPGAGHLYASSIDGRGLLLRLGGIGFYGAAVGLAAGCDDGPCNALLVPLGLATAFYLWGTIDSLATAPAAVRRHNAKIASPAIVPVIQPDRSAIMLVGQF